MEKQSQAVELLKSALSIARRKGEQTNWAAFEKRLEKVLAMPNKDKHKQCECRGQLKDYTVECCTKCFDTTGA